MEDEIFDMEKILVDDSFSVNDYDVLQILKTWRLNIDSKEEENDQEKQQLANTTNLIDTRTFTRPKKKLQQNNHLSSIEAGLPIGKTLKNSFIHRSFITDVSPPNSLESSLSFNECGNSLINSGDFTNINCLLNNQFENDAFDLKDYGSPWMPPNKNLSSNLLGGSKNLNLLKTDMDTIVKQSEELKYDCSDNFDKHGINKTFDTSKGPIFNQTFDQVAVSNKDDKCREKLSLSAGQLNETIIIKNEMDSSPKNFSLQIKVQSTPVHNSESSFRKYEKSLEVEDLSPITIQPTNNRRKNKLTAEQDIDRKRISLQNFEDVEKSIFLLENSEDEAGFDVILDNITDLEKSIDDDLKYKQKLHNIKTRHSQVNLERKQDDLFKTKTKIDSGIDLNNKIIDSLNKTLTISIGSERLLTRRSRMDDGLMTYSSEDQDAKLEQVEKKHLSEELSKRDRFKTMRITKKHIEGMVVIENEKIEQAVDVNEKDHEELVFKKPTIGENIKTIRARSLSKPKYYSGVSSDRKNTLQLQKLEKASSTDYLDSNRIASYDKANSSSKYKFEHNNGYKRPESNMKSPMGAKSKSYHNLVNYNATNSTGLKTPKYFAKYDQITLKNEQDQQKKQPYGIMKPLLINNGRASRQYSGQESSNTNFNTVIIPDEIENKKQINDGKISREIQGNRIEKEAMQKTIPSKLKQPTVKSGLPRPTYLTKR